MGDLDVTSPLLQQRQQASYGAQGEEEGGEHQQDNVDNPSAPSGFWSMRKMFALLACFGFANVYAMRVNLTVAIVAMVNHTAVDPPAPVRSNHSGGDGGVCLMPIVPKNQTEPNEDGPFPWDVESQGFVLGAFFYGYITTQLIGGRLAERYGGKWIYGLGVLVTTIFTLLTPMAAKHSYWMLILTRVIEGLGEGVTFPVMHAMISVWSPPMERSRMSAFVYSGAQLGTVLSLPISGLLCDAFGWESVFYVFGVAGIVWFVMWALLVADSPAKHSWMSEAEKRYIEESLRSSGRPDKAPSVPWRQIFTSGPVWAIIVAHCAQNWGFYTMLNELPTYMNQVLHFNIKENAFLSALPYLVMWVCSLVGSMVADRLRTSGRLTTTNTRKLFNSIAFLGPSVTLVMLIFAGCNHVAVITLLCLTVGLNGFNYSGVNCNHIDVAPNFAGTLMGISNTAANVMGFLTPMIISPIVEATEDLYHWHIVFIVSAVVYTLGDGFYVVFASGEVQPFNQVVQPEQDDEGQLLGAEEERGS